MSLISKGAVQAAFENAVPDMLADYGLDYGTRSGFSRDAVNRILTTAFASEKHFEPGRKLWIVERHEDGEAYGIGSYVFLAEVAGHAILSLRVNNHDDLEYLLGYHRLISYLRDYNVELFVVRLDDCYPSQMAARHALDEEVVYE